MNWQEYAACADADPEVFFPVGEPGSAGYRREVAVAKSYCRVCPVRAECLDDAVTGELADGVYGGTTPDERRPMQRASRFAETGRVGSVRVNLPELPGSRGREGRARRSVERSVERGTADR